MRTIFRPMVVFLFLLVVMLGSYAAISCSEKGSNPTLVLERMDRLTGQNAKATPWVHPNTPTYKTFDGIRVDGTDGNGMQQWGFVDASGHLYCCWPSEWAADSAAAMATRGEYRD